MMKLTIWWVNLKVVFLQHRVNYITKKRKESDNKWHDREFETLKKLRKYEGIYKTLIDFDLDVGTPNHEVTMEEAITVALDYPPKKTFLQKLFGN